MPNHPDWSTWILQKNSEAKQEELRKSEFVQLEKAVWEHAPHIKSQDCKCSGASRGDNMHHYSCVDANPKPAAIKHIPIDDTMSPKLKDAIDSFNKKVTRNINGYISWGHDMDGHLHSYFAGDLGEEYTPAKIHGKGLDPKDYNQFDKALWKWLDENEHLARPDPKAHDGFFQCVKGAPCGCNP